MNSKKAKALRKETGFHPKDPRQYVITHRVVHHPLVGHSHYHETLANSPATSRGRYQNLKSK